MKEQEIWKDVDEFPELFLVSNFGNVYSKRSNKILVQGTTKSGYKVISSKIGGRKGKCICKRVHTWVAKAFIDNPENKPNVNHKDGDKTNNFWRNLEWCTPTENAIHARDNGLSTFYKGEESFNSILKESEVLKIREFWNTVPRPYSQTQLAKIFGVSRSTIDHITSNRIWKHLL